MNSYCASLVLIVILPSLSIISEAQHVTIPLTKGGFELKNNAESIISYYGVFGVGSPIKTFKVLFDTSTSDCWIPHYEWYPWKTGLHYSTGYLGSESSTSEKFVGEKSINSRGTILTGELYADTIKLGDNDATMPGNRQGFIAISEESNDQFEDEPYDGVIGLSPATQSAVGIQNILIGLKEANIIGELEFAFWITPPMYHHPVSGQLALGGVNEYSYTGNFDYHNVTDCNNWQIDLQAVSLADLDKPGSCHLDIGCSDRRCQVAFDTGVTDAYGPSEQVTRIYDAIGTVFDSASNLQTVDCNRIGSLPHIVFQIDGLYYRLKPFHYVRRFKSGIFSTTVNCYIAIKPHLDGSKWILGTNYLSQYYTRFDFKNRRVGFAKLSKDVDIEMSINELSTSQLRAECIE